MIFPKIKPVSETNLIIYFDQEIEVETVPIIGAICDKIRTDIGESIVEVIPSYTSILVQYNPFIISYNQLIASLTHILAAIESYGIEAKGKCIDLPIYYDFKTGPDLERVASMNNLSISEVIERHIDQEYLVCAVGFAPGFAFLAKVDEHIATPRHTTPREFVPAGSVGIADQQTAVYPNDSPGGWNIIGNCPIPLYQPNQEPITPFEVGDSVRFYPITKTEFLNLGGKLWQD